MGVVLLVACANVALLSLIRGFDRRGEAAVRLALGASTPRLVREMFWEAAWLALAERPTAVTCSNDEMACGFIAELHRHGVTVPTDVSVVGFDDIDIAEQFIPALTTIHQPRNDIGEAAAAVLITRIGEGKAGLETPVRTKVLDVELVVRASTRSID